MLEDTYREYLAALNGRRFDDLDRFVHDRLTYNGEQWSRDDYKARLADDVRQIPDLRYEIQLLVVDSDQVACRLWFDCTPQDTFLGIDAGGHRVAFAEHVFYQFRDGRIESVWSLIDTDGIRRQLSAPVEELEDLEYDRVWNRFRQRFGFRPGMSSTTWPAINEPPDSVTWSLSALDDDPGYARLDAMVAVINAGLWACTPPDGTLLILDWQHTCYRIRPHAITAAHGPHWPASMMPDGDYSIHLGENFAYGTFGHPWENTICVFGPPLLDRVAARLDEILVRRVREGGHPVNSPS